MADISSLVRTDFKAVDKRDELNAVLGWLAGQSRKVPIVVDGEKPVGIVNERSLMQRHVDAKAHVEAYTLLTRSIPEHATLQQAADRLAEFRAAYVPVEDKRGRVMGYVTALDVARASMNGARPNELCFPVAGLKEDQTMGEALNLFTKEYVDVLPVMDAKGKVTGVLPRRAVLTMGIQSGDRGRKDAGGEKLHILKDPIHGFMDNSPIIVPSSATGETLWDTLEDNGYALVQERDGRFVGMVTPETIFRAHR